MAIVLNPKSRTAIRNSQLSAKSKKKTEELSNLSDSPTGGTSNTEEIGFVNSINSYLITIDGLPNIKINELVISNNQALGLVTSIENDSVEVLLLNNLPVQPKDSFRRTHQSLSINVGSHLLGRAIDPLGQGVDGKGGLGNMGKSVKINQPILGIKHRELITEQFQTGALLVDMLTPLALGQRELIIGDANSGKNEFLIDVILNQKSSAITRNPTSSSSSTAQAGNELTNNSPSFVCIYAMIGKPINEIRNTMDTLKTNQALSYTCLITTSSSEKASLIYLTPIVAVAMAEYFQRLGKHVLLILDDMGIHAKFYREISLLSGKPPGRESYPGDLFYQHARIIERAGRFNITAGGGSITALPVIETHLDDFTSFLTTSLMGMTDGHLLFSSSRFKEGIRPSVDISLSVSRVGRQTQNIAQKLLADKIKSLLADAKKLQNFSKFGSEISPQTRFVLKQADQVHALLNQPALLKISIPVQMILLGLVFTPFLQDKDVLFVERNKFNMIGFLETKFDLKSFYQQVLKMKDEKEFIKALDTVIPELVKVTK
jgi:proton translocating ATP synthase F1 alpha subunit